MNYTFVIKPKCFANELRGYKSIVNYEDLFNSLTDETRDDLILETNKIYNFIEETKNEDDDSINVSLCIDNTRDISDIPIDIELYVSKYCYNIYVYTKIGFYVYVKNTRNYIPQIFNFYKAHNNSEDPNEINNKIKNYIYNLLFYIYVFVREFQYDSLFTNFYHKDDIPLMKVDRLRCMRLFGNIDSECCVCLDKSLSRTDCNHILCTKCYSKLKIKNCPMCRSVLDAEEEFSYVIQATTVIE